jgi:hypothetical protein
MPRGAQAVGGQNLHWNALPDRGKIERKTLKIALTAVSVLIGFSAMFSDTIAPIFGKAVSTPMLAISHGIDRIKSKITATDELTYRSQYYTKEIRATLDSMGIKRGNGKYATVDELSEAAKYNKALLKIQEAPLKAQRDENRSSALMNGGAWAVTLIPGGAVAGVGMIANNAVNAAEVAKTGMTVAKWTAKAKNALPVIKSVGLGIGGSLAGGALASALAKGTIDPQELAEAITATVQDAKTRGMDTREVLSPKLLFTLRVAQDAALAKYIKETTGKPFHKLDDAAQLQVMAANKALADSAEMDVAQLASIQDPAQLVDAVRSIGATEADLSETRKYAVGTPGVSFVDRELQRRTAANDARIPESNVRSASSHVAQLQARRARVAAPMVGGRLT